MNTGANSFDLDSTLMELVKQGNKNAFHQLFDRYNGKIYGYSKKLLAGNSEKAEDITQSVWLKIAEKSSIYQSTGHFIAWAYTITRNLITDEFRKKSEVLYASSDNPADYSKVEFDLPEEMVQRENIEKALIRLSESIKIKKALASLPDNQKLILEIWMSEDISYEDLALQLNITLASVKSLLFRARQNMEHKLQKEDGITISTRTNRTG
jgi:RNA polymerase sigma-70 factor (ECF subfamily)